MGAQDGDRRRGAGALVPAAVMTLRALTWSLAAVIVASALPVAGYLLGGAAVIAVVARLHRGRPGPSTDCWAVPVLWAGVSAFVAATLAIGR